MDDRFRPLLSFCSSGVFTLELNKCFNTRYHNITHLKIMTQWPMKKILLLPVISILLFCAPAFADFAKGFDAAQKGDFATALKEWKPLAEQGNVEAQYNLGVMYKQGHGVIQDYKAAFKWFRKAAEQGHASAQYILGVSYGTGRGVPEDYIRAHMWSNIAASNGKKDGAKSRDIFTELMTPGDISKAQDMARECVAKDYKDC
jgi:hypothetical protein